MTPPLNAKIPSLNGWRAVAILLVMVSHATYAKNFPEAYSTGLLKVIFNQGDFGVRIFFVLSGFLITHLLLKEGEKNNHISLKQFYIRRCLRILPVYFSYVIVLALLVVLGFYSETKSSWLGVLSFSRNVVGQGKSATVHFWSLAVEEQFYFIWPLCLGMFFLHRRFWLALLILLIPIGVCPLVREAGMNIQNSGQILGRIFSNRSILAYADSLAVGCIGAFIIRRIEIRISRTQATGTLGVLCVMVFTSLIWKQTNPWLIAWMPTFQAIAIMVSIWITIHHADGCFGRILNAPIMEWVGVLSYSLYVWHVLFIYHFAGDKLGKLFVYDWRIWWLASFAMAVFSYYCVERPILKYKDRFKGK